MSRTCLPWISSPALLVAAAAVGLAQSRPVVDESYFAQQLYPLMHGVQCNLCHNDNGVASDTELEFPSADANPEQVMAFGLKLMDLVDRDEPRQSLLFLKPTNREEHTGGERIKQGSREEEVLLAWVLYLAELTEEQRQRARATIARAERLTREPPTVRRLTHSQYNHTIRDLLADESQPANQFPKEDFVRGFKNQVETQGVSPLQAEAYAQAAERLAASAFRGGDHLGLLPRAPDSPTDAECAEGFVRQFGLRAFRRPLANHEVRVYTRLFQQAAEREADFFSGAQVIVEAMLQSPHFLFRVPQGPSSALRQYEVASRLSYFLWDTMPTDELLRAAARGEFARPEQIEAAARRMLEDERARSSMQEFLAQWLRFDRVLSATRDRRRYRNFSTDVAAAMVEETRMLFHHLVWEDQNFMEFFTADYTFLSSDLARLYDFPLPSEEYAMVKYPANSGRGGVLGHGSFLVGTSKPSETSPTERGLFVRNHFLGHEVPAPPPGVNTALPDVTEDKPMTNRQRLQVHLNSAACAHCHRLIDPIGFGFEHYDAIGAFQEKLSLRFSRARDDDSSEESASLEVDLDTSGYIQGIENSNFSTPRELGRILGENEACQRNIVKQLFRYASGRQETASDQPVIDAMLKRFRDSGFRFRELIVAVAMSDLSQPTGEATAVSLTPGG